MAPESQKTLEERVDDLIAEINDVMGKPQTQVPDFWKKGKYIALGHAVQDGRSMDAKLAALWPEVEALLQDPQIEDIDSDTLSNLRFLAEIVMNKAQGRTQGIIEKMVAEVSETVALDGVDRTERLAGEVLNGASRYGSNDCQGGASVLDQRDIEVLERNNPATALVNFEQAMEDNERARVENLPQEIARLEGLLAKAEEVGCRVSIKFYKGKLEAAKQEQADIEAGKEGLRALLDKWGGVELMKPKKPRLTSKATAKIIKETTKALEDLSPGLDQDQAAALDGLGTMGIVNENE